MHKVGKITVRKIIVIQVIIFIVIVRSAVRIEIHDY